MARERHSPSPRRRKARQDSPDSSRLVELPGSGPVLAAASRLDLVLVLVLALVLVLVLALVLVLGRAAGHLHRADLLEQRRQRVRRERGRAGALVLLEGEREALLGREVARARDVQDRALAHLALARHELQDLEPGLALEDLAHARAHLEALVGVRAANERLEAAAAAHEEAPAGRVEDVLVPQELLVGPAPEPEPARRLEAREERFPLLHDAAELEQEAHLLAEELRGLCPQLVQPYVSHHRRRRGPLGWAARTRALPCAQD